MPWDLMLAIFGDLFFEKKKLRAHMVGLALVGGGFSIWVHVADHRASGDLVSESWDFLLCAGSVDMSTLFSYAFQSSSSLTSPVGPWLRGRGLD